EDRACTKESAIPPSPAIARDTVRLIPSTVAPATSLAPPTALTRTLWTRGVAPLRPAAEAEPARRGVRFSCAPWEVRLRRVVRMRRRRPCGTGVRDPFLRPPARRRDWLVDERFMADLLPPLLTVSGRRVHAVASLMPPS